MITCFWILTKDFATRKKPLFLRKPLMPSDGSESQLEEVRLLKTITSFHGNCMDRVLKPYKPFYKENPMSHLDKKELFCHSSFHSLIAFLSFPSISILVSLHSFGNFLQALNADLINRLEPTGSIILIRLSGKTKCVPCS